MKRVCDLKGGRTYKTTENLNVRIDKTLSLYITSKGHVINQAQSTNRKDLDINTGDINPYSS